MRILILTPDYPSPADLYANAFIHQRVVGYSAAGHNAEVFVYKWKRMDAYQYEGIRVHVGGQDSFLQTVRRFDPNIIAVHFFWFKLAAVLESLVNRIPIVVWAHGIDFLAWYRRLFNINQGLGFLKYAFSNVLQRNAFRRFIRRRSDSDQVRYVFASDWARRMAAKDLGVSISPYEIIPNPINEKIFYPRSKSIAHSKRVCFIRPFTSRKYAYDLAMKGIRAFNQRHPGNDLTFTIHGDGKEFRKHTEPIRSFDNVRLHQGFLKQEEMAEVYADHGIFLCPTRQDAQGVSMCEAMMAGLVPVASRNTAIPEFCDEDSGYLTENTVEGIAQALEELSQHPELFLETSRNAHARMIRICSAQHVIQSELRVLRHMISSDG